MAGEYRYIATSDAVFDGWLLLPLVQKKVTSISSAVPSGEGTPESPFKLSKPGDWMHCVRLVKSMTKGEIHILIWGRLIKIDYRCYVSDVGPAWRKGVAPEQIGDHVEPVIPSGGPLTPADRQKIWDQRMANQKRLRDLSTTRYTTDLQDWKYRNTHDEPSYRDAASKVTDPRLVYIAAPGWDSPMTWKEVASSPMIARAMRLALKGESLWSRLSTTGASVRDYSRIQKLLPVMTVAWFLGEPARNARVFLLNLLLLDLAERGAGYVHSAELTWDRLFWGPEILNFTRQQGALRPMPGAEQRMAPTSDSDRKMKQVANYGDLWTLGGVMSASPWGGANKAVKKEVPTKVGTNEAIRKVVTSGKSTNDIKPDYIHDKEISIVTQWAQVQFPGTYSALKTIPSGRVPTWDNLVWAESIEERLGTRSLGFNFL